MVREMSEHGREGGLGAGDAVEAALLIAYADGRVAAQGTPDEVRASTDPLVRQFVGMAVDGPVQFHYPGPTVEQDFGIEVAP